MPENVAETQAIIRNDWKQEEVEALFALPFNDLLYRAQTVHRQNFDPNAVQISTLLSIKTGGCAEDCGYCPQSAHHPSAVKAEPLMPLDEVMKSAQEARDAGASRFCMGAAWRNLHDRDLERVAAMVEGVKSLGLETCVTLGMLEQHQAERLKQAGLDDALQKRAGRPVGTGVSGAAQISHRVSLPASGVSFCFVTARSASQARAVRRPGRVPARRPRSICMAPAMSDAYERLARTLL